MFCLCWWRLVRTFPNFSIMIRNSLDLYHPQTWPPSSWGMHDYATSPSLHNVANIWRLLGYHLPHAVYQWPSRMCSFCCWRPPPWQATPWRALIRANPGPWQHCATRSSTGGSFFNNYYSYPTNLSWHQG